MNGVLRIARSRAQFIELVDEALRENEPEKSSARQDAVRNGIRTKISSWQRIPPNVIPHASKATGVYLNSMLAVHEAHRAGYDEAIMLTPEGTIADGPGETIFVVCHAYRTSRIR